MLLPWIAFISKTGLSGTNKNIHARHCIENFLVKHWVNYYNFIFFVVFFFNCLWRQTNLRPQSINFFFCAAILSKILSHSLALPNLCTCWFLAPFPSCWQRVQIPPDEVQHGILLFCTVEIPLDANPLPVLCMALHNHTSRYNSIAWPCL